MPKRNRLLELRLYLKWYWKPILEGLVVILIFVGIAVMTARYNEDPYKRTGYRSGTVTKTLAVPGSGPIDSPEPPSFLVFVQLDFEETVRAHVNSYYLPYKVGDAACVAVYERKKGRQRIFKMADLQRCER